MKDLYVFNNGRLKRKDHTILFINTDGQKRTLPIEQVENLHLFGEVDLNTSFLNLLQTYGIGVHVYNYYGYYSGSYIPRKKLLSGYVDVQQASFILRKKKRLYIAQQFVCSAAHHILRNLRRHKEVTLEQINLIEEERIKILETNNIPTLMGIEGIIRRIYYQSFNKIIKNGFFFFDKREKRPPNNPINALISFGNSVMYTTVLSEIYKTQLNPTMSFLHEPTTSRYSLALDLAEIFKPLVVDPLIFSLINNRMLKEKHFNYVEESICMLSEEGRKLYLQVYQDRLRSTVKHRVLKRKTSYRHMIRLECYKLIKHFIGEEDYKPLKAWW